ncbi:MAG: TonB-dependent receptor [Mucilaginibacter sp.]|nr:TonB-dependent receptor [Mucilaginibacter sp.]
MKNLYFSTTLFLLLTLLTAPSVFAQHKSVIHGFIKNEQGDAVSGSLVTIINASETALSNDKGFYQLTLVGGTYQIRVSSTGYEQLEKTLLVKEKEAYELNFTLINSGHQLKEVVVKGYRALTGMGYLNDVHDNVVYSGKKTEVILLDSLNANTAQNNPRQVLGRIPGANYSETEGSGFPSNGIGYRGLTPTQSIETNIRQNGYNVAADIYGYPEAYYLPPLEAVERIEVTRGAASLQFGPQFGGVINYIVKRGPTNKPIEINVQQTGGSFGLFNSFISAGGQSGKLNYYSFIQYKNVNGWRPNAEYQSFTGFAGLNYQANEKLQLGLEYSILRNRIQMPGGFTDEQFNQDSRASYRARNWLSSPWNIITGKADYRISANVKASFKSAYQFSERSLVWKNEDGGPGEPDSISTVTLEPVNREVQREFFHGSTNELRLTANYDLGNMHNTLATGMRAFYGRMKREGGGLSTTGSDFNLSLLDPHFEYSLDFTTTNIAPFAENIFRIGQKLTVTPGLRYEFVRSTINGYVDDGADELRSNFSKNRHFLLAGTGAQFLTGALTNFYANISQAYRPVTYEQLSPFGSSAKVDPNLKDSKGYNADLGWRGAVKNYLNFDISGFYLRYNNRIGIIQQTDAEGKEFLLRTNIANSIHKGIESYVELNLTKAFFPRTAFGNISFYDSFSYVDAHYISGQFKNKEVEYAPKTVNRLGITYALKGISTTFVLSNTAKSFGDASNAVRSDDPSVGIIPANQVMDWSSTLKIERYNIKLSVNNLADKRYFTLRTSEYPGPGIIPAIGRSFALGIGAKF